MFSIFLFSACSHSHNGLVKREGVDTFWVSGFLPTDVQIREGNEALLKWKSAKYRDRMDLAERIVKSRVLIGMEGATARDLLGEPDGGISMSYALFGKETRCDLVVTYEPGTAIVRNCFIQANN
ncbi:hypothetical protein KA183_21300 [bacterium]|nr:hypothetical protein [bacterium]